MPYPYNANPNNDLQQQIQNLTRQYQQLNAQTLPYSPVVMPQPQQIPIPVSTRQVQYVEGINGAKLYQENMPANSSEIIMDKNENIFYYVSKDANGTPSRTIPVGRFSIEEQQEEELSFLTRKDLDDFKEEIRQMLTKQTPTSTPVQQKTVTTTTSSTAKKS